MVLNVPQLHSLFPTISTSFPFPFSSTTTIHNGIPIIPVDLPSRNSNEILLSQILIWPLDNYTNRLRLIPSFFLLFPLFPNRLNRKNHKGTKNNGSVHYKKKDMCSLFLPTPSKIHLCIHSWFFITKIFRSSSFHLHAASIHLEMFALSSSSFQSHHGDTVVSPRDAS